MKICMPTAGDKGLTERVYDHFGSAPFFTIYDTETKEVQVLENDNQHHDHGACQPLAVIANHSIDAILTHGMGRRAVQILNEDGIKVFLLEDDIVTDAIKRYEIGLLEELTVENACGGHGNSHGCH